MTNPAPEDRAAALNVDSAAGAQIRPLLARAEAALRRSRALLELPIYPHDPMPCGPGFGHRGGERP